MATKTEVKLESRPPVVVVVGHVDHGKTTLLDYIRKASVAAREAGGITQAVGAYEIEHGDRKITFIDTPGHEAFSAMRSRGANIADLAILIVAVDEGMKPQTKEAIAILEQTKTPFIVALNKIDKVNAGEIEKTKNALLAAGVMLEGFGGQVSHQGISAKTGEGVDELLDLILLTADVENLTFDPTAPATGYVLEVSRDPRRGIEASVILKNGTLKRGELIATPTAKGKVKILENFLEKTVDSLAPSAPAIVIGFDTLPKVGEAFTTGDESHATSSGAAIRQVTGAAPKTGGKTLNLLLKASDGGSLEALSVVLRGLEKTVAGRGAKEIHIVDESVGDITDGDVRHASATSSTIIGFKNRIEKGAKILADAQSIEVITSNIVYDLSKAVEEFLTGKRGPAESGELEVLAVFNQEKLDKQLVGGRVVAGAFRAKVACNVIRQEVVGNGRVLELREKKTEIETAAAGKEIGLLVSSETLIQVGDRLVIHK